MNKGITLVALIITVIIMLIIAGVAIHLTIGDNGIFQKSEKSVGIYTKQEATEKVNLKITHTQMRVYAEKQRMPTLQEIANDFCEDEEIEYVEKESKRLGSIDKIEIGEAKSFFTKLKKYPYEFEIDSQLKLASIDGIKIAETDGYIKPEGIIKITEAKENIDVEKYKYADTSALNVPFVILETGTYTSANINKDGGSLLLNIQLEREYTQEENAIFVITKLTQTGGMVPYICSTNWDSGYGQLDSIIGNVKSLHVWNGSSKYSGTISFEYMIIQKL